MRPLWKDILLAIFLGMILPGLFLRICVYLHRDISDTDGEEISLSEDTLPVSNYRISVRDGDDVTEMELEEYLTGVILAELPADFELETKKAQAVAARTYAWKACTTGGKHGDGSVCTDATCCQAYVQPDTYAHRAEAVEAAREAVTATAGYVLTYEGEVIEATYFSCSGGSTEDALAVWGRDYPYLRATDSPGEENAAHYSDSVTFTAEEFRSALGVDLPGTPENWFGFTTYTAGGGVATVKIDGLTYTGTQLRSLLGLHSTAFSVAVEGNTIVFTTRGFGHRVGMSQYGADAMAVTGSSWQEILYHYYQGVQIDKIEDLG